MNPLRPQAIETHAAAACPTCGRPLLPHVPPSRCPYCLLRQGLPTGEADPAGETVAAPQDASAIALPMPGSAFGHYRVVRLLGQGGMGSVFEAEDLESGRRVALKVLGHQLDSPEARARFFREGRLAASVNHPNSVYVFGTEDIAGMPVIVMELMSGGTLQQRVSQHGPLPVDEVVDYALQIIDGLESAQNAGILHRDIKPSNCFLEEDGTVKIGDFGLSISTLVRTEPAITASGAFLGTPAFSSPEQLRGDELTVRSDIYSLGVTLYYLLTGRYPFEAPDFVRLVATVLEQRAESPAARRPSLPNALSHAVLRCLEKAPEKRFHSYAELRDALLPYASTAPTPATLGLRFLAHLADVMVLALPSSVMNLLIRGLGGPGGVTLRQMLLICFSQSALCLAYYGLLEGLRGASVGKLLCRLRVVRLDRTLPRVPRATLRVLILLTVPNALWVLARIFSGSHWSGATLDSWMAGFSLLTMALTTLMFVTARRHNGFAGVHDLLSGTRVILQSRHPARPSLPVSETAPSTLDGLPQIGPYHVLDHLDRRAESEWLLGFDACLLRRVWIRRLPSGTPPLPPHLRQLRRPGRLRWLVGKRTDTEAWDAYEAAPGMSLEAIPFSLRDWGRVRFWLLDLAEELLAASKDKSTPEILSLDRIWITVEGRAKLLDCPAPGAKQTSANTGFKINSAAIPGVEFLREVAEAALRRPLKSDTGTCIPPSQSLLPRHASQFLAALQPGTRLDEQIPRLRALLNAPAQVTRARRATLVAAVMALPLLMAVLASGVYALTRAFAQAAPELVTLRECLRRHHELLRETAVGPDDRPIQRDAFESYIVGRFAQVITNTASWNRLSTRMVLTDALRAEAERIIERTIPPSEEQFLAAAAIVEQHFGRAPDMAAREAISRVTLPTVVLAVIYGHTVVFIIIPSLLASLLFGGGALTRLLGIVYVDRTGAPASRGRLAWRNFLAWLPFLLLLLPINLLVLVPVFGPASALLVAVCLTLALALTSTLLHQRGLPDRLAGTWPVPR